MRSACIDIGSNTTRLLVADCDGGGGLRQVDQQKVFTRIRRGMLEGDWIAPHKISEVVAAVAGKRRLALDLGST